MKTNDPTVKQIAKAAFPDYAGRKFAIQAQEHAIDLRSSWDGGSRSYFRFVRLADNVVSQEVPAQSGYDRPVSGLNSFMLPEGFVCVEHTYFCGKDCGLTIHVNPANMARLLQ